jgi:glycosyltransferase involved in cell wall biosynthesis
MKIAILANSKRSIDENVTSPHVLVIRELSKGLKALGHTTSLYAYGGQQTATHCLPWKDWREFVEELTEKVQGKSILAQRELPRYLERMSFIREATHGIYAFQQAGKNSEVINLHWGGHLFGVPFSTIPVVYSIRHGYDDPSFWLENKQLFYSQMHGLDKLHWVVLSDSQKKFLPDNTPAERIHVINHGLSFDEFPTRPSKKQGYVAFLGRIMRLKAPHIAIDAARRASIPIKIAGGIDPMTEGEPDYFKEQIEPRLGPGVEYLGELGVADKIELLRGAIATINPFQLEEPFGLVMIESLACGTPLIVPKRGSGLEILKEGENGFYAETVETIPEAIEKCRSLDYAAIQQDVRVRFSVERMVNSYVEVYKQAIEDWKR